MRKIEGLKFLLVNFPNLTVDTVFIESEEDILSEKLKLDESKNQYWRVRSASKGNSELRLPMASIYEYEQLMEFIDTMEFDRLGVFTYSPEEDTPAAEMPDQIPEEIKEERQAELMELQQEIAFDQAEDMIGTEVLVMIEGKVADENAYVGRTYKDAPNVDGLIFVNTEEELMSGDFARVRVTGALEYDLIGELIV